METTSPSKASVGQIDRVRSWRQILERNQSLSERFRSRYAVVLSQLEAGCSGDRAEAARALAQANPQHAAAVLAGLAPALSRRVVAATGQPRILGDGPVAGFVRALVTDSTNVEDFLASCPPLEQTNVPLHPARCARLISIAPSSLVALKWRAGSAADRWENQNRMKRVVRRASMSADLVIEILDDYAVADAADGDIWVFAVNLGATLEDLLRSPCLSYDDRRRVVRSLAVLRATMLNSRLVWQGFAPRNMFLRNGRLILIDFEEVVDARSNPARAAECLLWHRVFFADCLDEGETALLFQADQDHPLLVPDGHTLHSDPFERALLRTEVVTWAQRRELLNQSIMLEGRHRRPSTDRDRGILSGHELGHFWGDFVPPSCEVRLFQHLSVHSEPNEIAACLEVLEAAMEADICRMLRLAATSQAEVSAPRTAAVADLLDSVGGSAVAGRRLATADWYQRLETDPAGLVDDLLYTLGSTVDGVDRRLLETYLVGGTETRTAHERSLSAAVQLGLDFIHRADDGESYLRYAPPDDLRRRLGKDLLAEGVDFDTVLGEVSDLIVTHSILQSHPRYLAFPDSGNALAALAGNILSPLLNQNLIATDRSAPAATLVEIQVIEWLRQLVGYSVAPLTELHGVKDVAGLWTTGGHLSNHIAMLVALNQTFPEARRRGLRGLDVQPAILMAGPIAHYSHSDAAFHLGLGWDSVLNVEARPGYTTDPDAMDRVLADPPSGRRPFMVIGVAGNCRTTGLDDLVALGEVCRRHDVWYHVDACHGGSLIFSDRLRRRYLDGIEQAQSISLDPHKGLFTPYPSSYVIFRDRGVLNHFSRHEKTVLEDDCWDLGLITPFLGSRGFESLATWMLLRHVGTRRLGAIVESRQALVRYLERRIDESGLFVRLNDVDFYRLAFVFCPPPVRAAIRMLNPDDRWRAVRAVSEYTSRLNTALYRSGEVCFDEHTLDDLDDRVGAGRGARFTIMAACPGNPLTTKANLDLAIDRLLATARPLIGPMLQVVSGGAAGTDYAFRAAGPAGWNDVA